MLHIQMCIFCWLDCFWAPSLLRNSPLSFSLVLMYLKKHFCNTFFPASDLLSESSWILIYELFKTLRIQLEFLEFFVWIGDSPWLVCLLLFRLMFWIFYRSLLFVKFISWNVLVKLLIVLIKSFWIAYKRNRSDLHALCTAIIMISPPSIHE